MKITSKIVIDILIAIAISLVINFSHLMLIFVDQEQQTQQQQAGQRRDTINDMRVEGIFHKSLDGHGYVVFKGERGEVDSAYLAQGKVNRYSLAGGDTVLTVITPAPEGSLRHAVAQTVWRRNGVVVAPYASSSPQRVSEFITQMIYYFLLSLVVITLATSHLWRRISARSNLMAALLAIGAALLLYLFAPVISHRFRGDMIIHFLMRGMSILDYMIILKWSFALIVSLLYSQIYTLLSQRQNIILENEKLRAENINAQYNMLMSQINPHVLFNSLNSLAMLVREGDEQRSLTYIDQLSYTFRYILQNRESTLTTLAEEMKFVEAYIYLLKIRYADKLFFDIDIAPEYSAYLIPALSLQPLLDNAVKHNTIISSRPFHVSIRAKGGVLEVSNQKYPKLDAEPSTGVGLENLARRWQLIADEPIEVVQDETTFSVKLPLIAPRA